MAAPPPGFPRRGQSLDEIVYRTEDRGQTWTKLTDSGVASDRVWTVGLDPAAPDELLPASPAGGLHLFTLCRGRAPPTRARGLHQIELQSPSAA